MRACSREGGELVVVEELELGDADAVLARDHAAERRASAMMRATASLASCSIA
jgi:hypothetical protein